MAVSGVGLGAAPEEPQATAKHVAAANDRRVLMLDGWVEAAVGVVRVAWRAGSAGEDREGQGSWS